MADGAAPRRRSAAVSSLLLALVVGVGLAVTALAHGAATVRARIELDQKSVRAGAVLRGRLILENAGSTPQVLLSGCLTNGRFLIGFRPAGGHAVGGAFSVVGCQPLQALVVARPGRTVYRFAVATRYQVCFQTRPAHPPGGTLDQPPLCLKDGGGMPALPVGRYEAVFQPDGDWKGPSVTPAPLTVTRAR